ncbi:MAG: DNA-binding protein WhiA [Acholeplasmatales bacterium]|nr:DNA-binding protein WhiA [Acholeplasmatales bacterium]
MSFAQECKTEIANVKPNEAEMATELEALLRLSAEVILRDLKFIVSFESANAMTSRRVLSFIKTIYKAETELNTRQVKKLNQGIHYQVVVLTESDKIIKEYNLLGDNLHQEEIANSDLLKNAYLRGAFLARGSINDPQKGDYHLEISTTNQEESMFIQRLMVSFELNAKIVKRRNDFVIYLKDVSEISDFLRIIGASSKVFELDELVIKREYKTNIQRQMNAEIANQIKTNSAAKKQIQYIHTIEYNYPLEKLDPRLLLVMKVRLENKEASLTELIEIIERDYHQHITKSGINHRFMKIKELAEEIMANQK